MARFIALACQSVVRACVGMNLFIAASFLLGLLALTQFLVRRGLSGDGSNH